MLRPASILFFLLLLISCSDTQVSQASYSNSLGNYKIDTKENYNQVLKKALELNEESFAKVRSILASYRKNLKAKPERAEVLKKNRGKKLDRVLTPIQMKKRKYVNSIYYNNIPKYPTHPANIKSKYKLSDGQVLKLIEIEGVFAEDKKLKVRKERIETLIGKANAAIYLEGKALII